jgi:hypothetical protein
MAIGKRFLVFATPADVERVQAALSRIDEARAYVESAVEQLDLIERGFDSERSKLRRSAEALIHERRLLCDRLNELLDAGKRYGGCLTCGCAQDPKSDTCANCNRVKPAAATNHK